jgi:hypothetical protein
MSKFVTFWVFGKNVTFWSKFVTFGKISLLVKMSLFGQNVKSWVRTSKNPFFGKWHFSKMTKNVELA